MGTSWPKELMTDLELVRRILLDVERRLRQASPKELLALASYAEANWPAQPLPARAPQQPPNHRQNWCLQQLRESKPVSRKMLEEQFGVTDKTAKRDLSELIRLKLIRYVRTPRPGHYELAVRHLKGSSPDQNGAPANSPA